MGKKSRRSKKQAWVLRKRFVRVLAEPKRLFLMDVPYLRLAIEWFMPIQKCPMCLETKDVVSSHLYPAATYDNCRSSDDHSPMRVGDGVVMLTDRQLRHPLLCLECENILNKGGEAWVIPKLATVKQSFPLYDILTEGSPAFQDEACCIFCAADNPRIAVEKLTHFALGIFWKAAVHSWKGDETSPLIQLGRYAETIRLWLRSGSSFPRNVSLSVSLARPGQIPIVLTGPVESPRQQWHKFWLYTHGVSFILSVGRLIAPEMREICVHENPLHPIFVSDDVTREVWKRMQKDYRESRKTRAYLKATWKSAAHHS